MLLQFEMDSREDYYRLVRVLTMREIRLPLCPGKFGVSADGGQDPAIDLGLEYEDPLLRGSSERPSYSCNPADAHTSAASRQRWQISLY